MPTAMLHAYSERLPRMLAEMRLILLDVVAFPHLDAKSRSRLLHDWERTARGTDQAQIVPPAVLHLAGIGLEFKPVKPVTKVNSSVL